MHCRMISRILGPYSLDASTISGCDNQTYLQTLPDVLWEQNHPLLRHIGPENLDEE